MIYTGNPIRRGLTKVDKRKALEFFGFSADSFTILVMGGSQGSHRINAEFSKAVAGIPAGAGLQVIHLCGNADYDFLNEQYRGSDIKVKLFRFLDAMHYAYSASDLALCRSGALTISEIIFFGLPAVVVPYPYAYAHQMENARVLLEKGSAVMIRDEELSAALIKDRIEYFMAHRDKLEGMRFSYRGFILPDASRELAGAVLELAA